MEETTHQKIETLACSGNLAELKLALSSGYSQLDLDVALECAIAYSYIEMAEFLLELGADFSNYNFQGVYYAVHNDEIGGLQFAIAKGVDINVNQGMLLNTSIMTATNTKSIEMVAWLLENGADLSLLTEQSRWLADTYGSEELKQLLTCSAQHGE